MITVILPAMLLLASVLPALAEPPVLLLEERFNSEDQLSLENGAELGKGLSGQAGDLCYFADTTDYVSTVRGPIALFSTPKSLEGGQAMTVVLWYKFNHPAKGFGALLLAFGWNVSIGEDGVTVWLYESREMNSRYKTKSGMAWDSTEWAFLVLTWSNADRTGRFLRGSTSEPAVAVGQAGVKLFPDGISSPADARASAGNSLVFGKSPFGGCIDNLRVFDRVLEDDEIEAIRQADLKNAEPKFAQ